MKKFKHDLKVGFIITTVCYLNQPDIKEECRIKTYLTNFWNNIIQY